MSDELLVKYNQDPENQPAAVEVISFTTRGMKEEETHDKDIQIVHDKAKQRTKYGCEIPENGVAVSNRSGQRRESDLLIQGREGKSRNSRRRPSRFDQRHRRRSRDRRMCEERRSLERERNMHETQRDYFYSDESMSEDNDSLSSADSDSEKSTSDGSLDREQGWGREDVRSKRDTLAYKIPRNRRGKHKKSGKKHHGRHQDNDFPNHHYLSTEKNDARPSNRRVSSPHQPESTSLLKQMLRNQDIMVTKLDAMVNLLRKTVRALTAQQRGSHYGRNDEIVYSGRKRPRGVISDSDRSRAKFEPHASEKRPRYHLTQDLSPRRADSYLGGDVVSSENGIRHRNEATRGNEELQPRISSYYSVRGEGMDIRQQERQHSTERYKNHDATVISQGSFSGEADRRPNVPYSTSLEENFVVNPSSPGRVQASLKPATGKQNSALATGECFQNDEAQYNRTEQPDGEVEETSHAASSSEFTMGRSSTESQRSLKRDSRPSMVDLSQTNNALIPQKYYAPANGYSQSGKTVEPSDVNSDTVHGEQGITYIFQEQPWKEDSLTDGFKSPNSRKRESLEPTPWLARTLTTGSGKGDGGTFTMNGKEFDNKKHEVGKQAESTDNKKMMSNVNHLTLSTMCVSSEIVQVLVVTPSDQNNDKDAPRKSMERVLNQSLALMGCLPLIAEIDLSVVQKIYHGSKNCMSFIYRLMDHCYTREELMKCRVAGGVRKYRGNNTETEQLCPRRLRTILKLASDLYPNEYAQLTKANMIRNNINMKCRKTVIRDNQESDVRNNSEGFQTTSIN